MGCGKVLSKLLLVSEYEAASFLYYDIHSPSIGEANTEAKSVGLSDRLQCEVSDAEECAGRYNIITFLDCLHEMGEPLGAACYARSKLTSSRWVILIEPSASDRVKII